MLGGYRSGVRVSATISGAKGTFAKIAAAISKAGGNIVGLGFDDFSKGSEEDWEMTIKVQDLSKNKLVTILKPVVRKINDARTM